MKLQWAISLLLLFCSIQNPGCAQQQPLLLQDYNLLSNDNQVNKLRQSNDTLLLLKCTVSHGCFEYYTKHYKIINAEDKAGFVILKLERLDSLKLTEDPYPKNRYYVTALRNVGNRELGYLPLRWSLTRLQLDTVQIDTRTLEDKFFISWLSDSYLKELSVLKKLTTKEAALEIMEYMKSERFRPLVQSYARTETNDMYGMLLLSELRTRACIENGYDPYGAGEASNRLLK